MVKCPLALFQAFFQAYFLAVSEMIQTEYPLYEFHWGYRQFIVLSFCGSVQAP